MKASLSLVLLALLGNSPEAIAEPYLAVREGLKCSTCHVNPTGGGMRTAFGHAYTQTVLPAERVGGIDLRAEPPSGLLLGGDLRTVASYTKVPNDSEKSAFEAQDFRVYLAANVVPDHLVVYTDQQVAPGSGQTQEAYARLWLWGGKCYVKAGQMYLPFGLRLEDDTAFIREKSGINFTTPDNGLEFGFEGTFWTVQLAVSNGTAGGPEVDNNKSTSLRVEHIRPRWRLGASFNHNDSDAGVLRMQNLLAGLKTGPVVWLAEIDYIEDETQLAQRASVVSLWEGNWAYRQGHNLKLTGEYFDPDDDVGEDQQVRHSLVWEYTPIQFLQVRLGGRMYDGIPQNDVDNRSLGFLEFHAFF